MAFHSKKDFAQLCGIATKHISTYITRGKIIIHNELIDDQNQVNATFIAANKAKKELSRVEEEADPVVKSERNTAKAPVNDELTKNLVEKTDLEIRQRKNTIHLQDIEIQKKQGELIPTMAVKNLVVLHSESIKTAYVEASDNLIVILASKHQLTSEDIADIRKKFLDIINKAVDSAIDASKRSLSNIIKEYSIKRGVGQHD